jgi:hypothetical protein
MFAQVTALGAFPCPDLRQRTVTKVKPVVEDEASKGLTSRCRARRMLRAGGSSPRRRQGGAQFRCQKWCRREAPPDQRPSAAPPPGAAEVVSGVPLAGAVTWGVDPLMPLSPQRSVAFPDAAREEFANKSGSTHIGDCWCISCQLVSASRCPGPPRSGRSDSRWRTATAFDECPIWPDALSDRLV